MDKKGLHAFAYWAGHDNPKALSYLKDRLKMVDKALFEVKFIKKLGQLIAPTVTAHLTWANSVLLRFCCATADKPERLCHPDPECNEGEGSQAEEIYSW